MQSISKTKSLLHSPPGEPAGEACRTRGTDSTVQLPSPAASTPRPTQAPEPPWRVARDSCESRVGVSASAQGERSSRVVPRGRRGWNPPTGKAADEEEGPSCIRSGCFVDGRDVGGTPEPPWLEARGRHRRYSSADGSREACASGSRDTALDPSLCKYCGQPGHWQNECPGKLENAPWHRKRKRRRR